jgi:hypothetical protein
MTREYEREVDVNLDDYESVEIGTRNVPIKC